MHFNSGLKYGVDVHYSSKFCSQVFLGERNEYFYPARMLISLKVFISVSNKCCWTFYLWNKK